METQPRHCCQEVRALDVRVTFILNNSTWRQINFTKFKFFTKYFQIQPSQLSASQGCGSTQRLTGNQRLPKELPGKEALSLKLI